MVATGAYQQPYRPAAGASLPPEVPTFDARTYREPASVPDGVVVVVGGGQTGSQIAEDLLDVGREVVIAYGKVAWAPRRMGDHDLLWWALETGFFEQTVDDLPSPVARLAANLTASGVHGGHDLHARTLQARGATVVGRLAGIRRRPGLGSRTTWPRASRGETRATASSSVGFASCASIARCRCPTSPSPHRSVRRVPTRSTSRPWAA